MVNVNEEIYIESVIQDISLPEAQYLVSALLFYARDDMTGKELRKFQELYGEKASRVITRLFKD